MATFLSQGGGFAADPGSQVDNPLDDNAGVGSYAYPLGGFHNHHKKCAAARIGEGKS
jgi:hypothetical protein